ncbi:MAG: discoidin domain-containing protein [Acidiphilium sp.]|nr:discoidin domain-containing protein [Acidiphilium sp.]
MILTDETNSLLEIESFSKLAHNSDFSDLGLFGYPPPSILWYNGEYPLYRLRSAFPEASAYGMVEFDVSATADLLPIFDAIARKQVDLVAHDLHDVGPDWGFYHTVSPHFSAPMQAMIHSLFVSPRAIDHMLARRQQIAAGINTGAHPMESWPFCEGFVPSSIRELPNARLEELQDYVKLPYYISGTPLHIANPQSSEPGSLIHPVLSGARLNAKRMEFDNPADIFNPDSALSRQFRYCLPSEFIDPLIDCFKRKQPAALPRFLAFAAENNWLASAKPINLARGRPADQSSVSPHSRFPETHRDASGGNDGNIGGGYGFWTGEQTDPYWQVDFENICRIERVTIHNFLGARDQCTNLAILISSDQTNWSLAATKLDNAPFGGADGTPYHFDFPTPPRARYCRIQLVGHGALHLDEIEVFGLPD